MDTNKKTQIWLAIIVATIPVIPAVVTFKVGGVTWILYLCGVIIVVSFGVLVWDRFIGLGFGRYRSNRRAMRLLKKNFERYGNIVEKFRVLEDIEKSLCLDKIEWNSGRPELLRSVQNSLYCIKAGLDHMPSEYRLIALNVALGEVVRPFDRWLSICDFKLKNGEAIYKTEEAQNSVMILLRKFTEITSAHDDLCEEINSKINQENLNVVGLFCQDHVFSWKNSEPECK